MESLPFAIYLQKLALYSMLPWKRRIDKAMQYLESAMASKEKKGSEEITHLLDVAASQRCKPMLLEILAKRSRQNYDAQR